MKLKVIALLMTVLMVGPALVACKDDKKDGESGKETGKSTTSKVEDATGNEFAYIDEYVDGLTKEYNFDGKTFTMIGDESDFPEEYALTGVLEDDALYNRYRELEEKFGIELDLQERSIDGTDYDSEGTMIAEEVYRDIMAGGSTYDLVAGGSERCGKALINNGVLRSISDMPGFDFSNEWWIPDIERQLGIGEDLFCITGKANSSHYFQPGLIVFSKKVKEDYGIKEDFYQLVTDGEWTVDKMFEIASIVPTNSSAAMDGTFRYYVQNFSGFTFYAGAGFTLTQKDDDGNPYIESALSSEQVDFIQKMSEVFGDTSQNFHIKEYEKVSSTTYDWTEDRILFSVNDLHHVSWLKDTGVEFGLLPIPKKDSSQEEYYAYSEGTWTKSFFFPINLEDEEMSGVITEAMAALSEKYLEPAYYEKALQGRATYDVESRDMLDIVYSSEVIELADIYKWGNLTDTINKAMLGDADTVVSNYNVGAKMAKNNINSLLKQISKSKDK